MYVGRVLGIGLTLLGRHTMVYRVSSRSYSNRRTVIADDGGVDVSPEPGHERESASSRYVTYRCMQPVRTKIVGGNGSHVEPLAAMIHRGTDPITAIGSVLSMFGHEFDDLNTPRLAALVDMDQDVGWIGVVRSAGLEVTEVALQAGSVAFVATYALHSASTPARVAFANESAVLLAEEALSGGPWKDFDHPVASAAAIANDGRWSVATA